ncbi:MAG TPA: type II toxin-antitoxin system antitoxin SocA domain-containing protein [Prolixibacteraceae bacterium]|nr:type II toxin-antitoxin system antitoxin SocA domain-containing protein [Prolixibacteraceae bacterium]
MKSPYTGKEMKVSKELRDMTFRKETFQVVFHYYICEESGEQFEDEHFSALNYNQVVNQYRVRHHIPFPEEIRKIRLKYDLSASKMSEILGLGTNSWRNYEGGEVPSTANANLIHLMAKPENFVQQIQLYCSLADNEKEKIIKHVQKLITGSCYCADPLYRFNNQPDIYTGFKAFDRIKTEQVIAFFAERLQPFKTKMNKLLFYADFVHFRNTAQSITGLRYNAIQFGPVPHNYDILFGTLAEIDIIDIEYAMTQDGEVERILPNPKYLFDASLFSSTELEVMEYIANKFKETSASDIAKISHLEPAWKENIEGKRIIPFTYAFELETV